MKNNGRTKALSWLLTLAMLLSLVPIASLTAYAGSEVKYLDASGTEQSITDYTVVDSSTTTLRRGWYVVNSDVEINQTNGISVSGDANLILCDGAKLTVTSDRVGITAARGSLTIYAQSTSDDMGKLEVTSNNFGILLQKNLTINGGKIETQGSNGILSQNADITINGGNVTADGGIFFNTPNNLTITGGKVIAFGTGADSGIDTEGEVIISGGNVSVTGDDNPAIRGTVKNSIAGTGWTNKAGTEGKADIAISTGQTLSYKKVQFPAASVTEYPLWVGGTQVTSDNATNITGAETPVASFDAETYTLTLSGANITEGYEYSEGTLAGLYYTGEEKTLNIKLADGTKNSIQSDEYYVGINSDSKGIVFSGKGSLDVAAYDFGIAVSAEGMWVNGCTLNVSSVEKGAFAVYSEYDLTVNGGEFNASNLSDGSFGIFTSSSSVTINGGKVTADGGGMAIFGTVNNAVAGTGWADAAGTEGKATIATSTAGQDLSSYKKLQFPKDPTELQSISEETTWDFSTGVTYSGTGNFQLNDTEKETVYADFDALTFASTFNAEALSFKGTYPFLNNNKKYAQDGTLRFNTTVPGTVTVTFTDVGTSASASAVKRYLVVNGTTTEYWTSRENNGDNPYNGQLNVTTGAISVPAGDVTITGTKSIAVSKVTFTPASAGSVTVTWNGSDIPATLYSANATADFSKDGVTLSGAKFQQEYGNYLFEGTFTTTLGNFTKIVVAADYTTAFTPAYGSGSSVWEGNASSVTVPGWSQNVTSITFTISPHTHSFTYTADGATITATCTADGCALDDGTEQHKHAVTLTIVKPTLTTYAQTGEGISASATLTGLTDFNTATGKTIAETDIKYVGRDGTVYTESATAPTGAGKYTAKITVEEKTASVDYEIAKADPTYTVPTGLTATYGQTLKDVTLPTGWAWADGTASVGGVGTNTFKASFTPTDTTNYNVVSGIDVNVTVGKAAGKAAVISTDTMSYNYNSIYIEGVEGQEYVIVPKGTAVTDADWNTSVKPDPERDNWVFFEDLNEATEFEIYTRTAETETAFASDAVKANVYTTLSSIGYLYDSTLVGASITVEPEPNVEGLTYKWYHDEVTEDDEGIIHHNLTEIPGASGSTYIFREEDAGKHIAVKIFSGDSEVGDFATDTPVELTAKVIFESSGGSDVETLTDVAYQSKIKAPADPTREGFAFDGWYWDEEFETPFDFENDVITWNETTLYAKWTPNDYKIVSVSGLSGANEKQWTKGSKDAVVITVEVSGEDNSFDHFTGVKLDGVELVKDVDYTAEKGSTVVTLKPETLEKLDLGEHTVTVLFDNGEVNTTLTVLAASGGNATSPQTGDNSRLGLWIALMMLSLLGIAATLFIGKKKRVFDR